MLSGVPSFFFQRLSQKEKKLVTYKWQTGNWNQEFQAEQPGSADVEQ